MKTSDDDEFTFFGINEQDDNQQENMRDVCEEFEIQLWGNDALCQQCYRDQGLHYADGGGGRWLFVCNDCFNRNFSIDLPLPRTIH